jgi:Ca2+-binding RTX toxin-like protein
LENHILGDLEHSKTPKRSLSAGALGTTESISPWLNINMELDEIKPETKTAIHTFVFSYLKRRNTMGIFGSEANDWLFGGDGNDQIYGFSGDDYLDGGAGNDLLVGDHGDDTLFGGDGDDILVGMLGDDFLDGGDGSDWFDGFWGDDTLFGGKGDDLLNGSFGNDLLNGGDGDDKLFGDLELFGGDEYSDNSGHGNDTLYGGIGNDFLDGGAYNDRLIGIDTSVGYGVGEIDTLIGGAGKDTFVLGDSKRCYYNDGYFFTSGEHDYARIVDFNPLVTYGYNVVTGQSYTINLGDTIELNGTASDYQLVEILGDNPLNQGSLELSDTAIYRGGGSTSELVGVIQDVSGLDLNAGYLTYLSSPPIFTAPRAFFPNVAKIWN